MAARAHHGALSRESGLIAIDSRAFSSARVDSSSLAECNVTRMDVCHADVFPSAPSTAKTHTHPRGANGRSDTRTFQIHIALTVFNYGDGDPQRFIRKEKIFPPDRRASVAVSTF